MRTRPVALVDLERRAAEVGRLLRALGNERRLLVLCHVIEEREASPGKLAEIVGLSHSALSQHLAKLRDEGLVTVRREGTTLHYRVADPRLTRLLTTLRDLFCRDTA
jgi:DNA-binding transcriptional ArsR family regulator